MLRCTNCGWFNPDHLKECEKCGEPLEFAPQVVADEPQESKEDIVPSAAKNPKPGHPMSETEPKPKAKAESKSKFAKTVRFVSTKEDPTPVEPVAAEPAPAAMASIATPPPPTFS